MTEQTPRDLAAEVDELTKRLDTLISKTGTDCDLCDGRGWNINVPSQSMYPCNWCNGKGKVNVSPAEFRRDPDPVCANPKCGHHKRSHANRGQCLACHGNDCLEFVPTADPAPLDPVLVPSHEWEMVIHWVNESKSSDRIDYCLRCGIIRKSYFHASGEAVSPTYLGVDIPRGTVDTPACLIRA